MELNKKDNDRKKISLALYFIKKNNNQEYLENGEFTLAKDIKLEEKIVILILSILLFQENI